MAYVDYSTLNWDDIVNQAKQDHQQQWSTKDSFDPYTGGQTTIGGNGAQIYLDGHDQSELGLTNDPWSNAVFNLNNPDDPNQPQKHMTQLSRGPDGKVKASYYEMNRGAPAGMLAVLAAPLVAGALMGAPAAAAAAPEAATAVGAAAPAAEAAVPGALGSGMFGAVGPSVESFGLGAGVGEISTGGVLAGMEGAGAIGAITPSLGGASAADLLGTAYPGAEGFTMGGAAVGPEIIGTAATGGPWGVPSAAPVGADKNAWNTMTERIRKGAVKEAINNILNPKPAPAARAVPSGAGGLGGGSMQSAYIPPPQGMGALQQVQAANIPLMAHAYGNTNLVRPTLDWKDFQ